ncbi:lipocalin family protein [Muricauda sp. SCSIO 64092]|uniref:lipocalin family protein n=1 Tax=Allomuricauda sp. SCSIO 64092 TaxID=2908842 RepID=UPI001FF577E2|nr:lipocalin family protein [Muricauda sp. SCSIO 64092]UOY05807.1 lipocalin family protein [Muricauda sp. SCSIO 64092]
MIPLTLVLFATLYKSYGNNIEHDCCNKPSIVGTWLEASSSTEVFTNNVSDGTITETVDAGNFIRITFNADGTFSDLQSYSYTENGDVVVKTSTDVGTYSINGNMLFIVYDGETDTGTVEFTLRGAQLVIEYVEEFTENGNQMRLVTKATYNRQ